MTKSIFGRRTFLKGTAVGAGILAAPAIISRGALASSGELNFTGWAGYPDFAAKVFPAFEAATGIKVTFTELAVQDLMFAQAKVALQSGGIDIIEPTLDRWGGWNENGLLQPFDEAKLAVGNYLPGLADGAAGDRSRKDGQLFYVPSNWGTEALVARQPASGPGELHLVRRRAHPRREFCAHRRRLGLLQSEHAPQHRAHENGETHRG